MGTVLLACEIAGLRQPCYDFLQGHGYWVVPVRQPLDVLRLPESLRWDAAVVDDSSLGRGVLDALSLRPGAPVLGLGLSDARLVSTLELPLDRAAVVAALDCVTSPASGETLELDVANRVVSSAGDSVSLTRIETRVLQLLLARRPDEVPLKELLMDVWGSAEGEATSEMVRAHMRNLRRKLAQIGINDAIRVRRGRGYTLVL